MAFGINRKELEAWKQRIENGNIAFLTHYWQDERFPDFTTVTKVGCTDIDALIAWGEKYNLRAEWIHNNSKYPHFDLLGDYQKEILTQEKQWEQLTRFQIMNPHT
ncbi:MULTISPECIES: hypothetical protein [unclassified Virgibacillus]|uniref:hypothetical protein n=1 Tax=unclassified Virgibacillus TaxID=2620237 RepID=UPI0024DE5440|nr:hypothetical protein [Virgibacillus sp. LDC-1]